MTDNHLVSTSATRLVQGSVSSAGPPGREMDHEREMRHNESEPVSDVRNAGDVVQTLSSADDGSTITIWVI